MGENAPPGAHCFPIAEIVSQLGKEYTGTGAGAGASAIRAVDVGVWW